MCSNVPDMVFLMEVKVGRSIVERAQRRIRFEGSFYVPSSINDGGGLALFWRMR